MSNDWIKFLKQHKGQGYSMAELSKKYCNAKLKMKVEINLHEPRYKNKKQAIAVSYAQVRKMYPRCKNVF